MQETHDENPLPLPLRQLPSLDQAAVRREGRKGERRRLLERDIAGLLCEERLFDDGVFGEDTLSGLHAVREQEVQ
jgi:hypothetical protein